MVISSCPTCHMAFGEELHSSDTGIYTISCPKCGAFGCSEEAISAIGGAGSDKQRLLSALLRERKVRKLPALTLKADNLSQTLALAPKSTIEVLDRLLVNIYSKTSFIGQTTKLELLDHGLGFAKNNLEFAAELQYLNDLGLIRGYSGAAEPYVSLTVDGIKKVEELLGKASVSSSQGFVAMSFRPDMSNVWATAMEPAIMKAGYRAYRVDRQEHNEKIDDLIIIEIRRSRFLVADFTHHRQGVYFEAGFALGMELPVIWTCNKKDLKKTHFDTRQYNHITWETTDELEELLNRRIVATIGQGPGRGTS